MSKHKLTDRQIKAIPHIVSSPTYGEGCKKARINRTTLYKWLKIPEFKAELDRQRDEVAAEAFGILSQSLTKAVETLAGLLDNKDDSRELTQTGSLLKLLSLTLKARELLEQINGVRRHVNPFLAVQIESSWHSFPPNRICRLGGSS